MTTDTSTNSLNLEMKKINTININSNQINNQQIKNKNTEINNNTHSDGRWNSDEHKRFIKGCLLYGNNWKKVEGYVQTRTSTQIRSHAQKFLIKLKKKYDIYDENEKLKFFDDNDAINIIQKDIYFFVNNLKSNEQFENEMETIEIILLKLFNINQKNGDILVNKRINLLSNSNNEKIVECEKEIKNTQLKDKIKTWLNSNEGEDLYNLLYLININDEKIKLTLQNIFQLDEIYRQIIYNE
jgi:SHAQKYF class myb-like DNA-binding protein